ncbi:uncharacterized protein LOC113163525 [Anabas testudineus]|uniref:uncharacterized protein LOC113163525 n=1 Tax=Anabas testudineus TaxID=64144 RepID=UPI000E453DBD|nr:uncharacterized protein LOC113163525 [Anabas testudineus]
MWVTSMAVDVTRLESGSRQSALDLLLQKHDLTQAVEVMKRFLTEIKRNDLVASLSNISPGRTDEVHHTKQTWISTHEDIYPVSETSKANRVALLIANKYFYDTSTRRAAEKDEKSMEQLLQYLGYEVVKYNDLNGQEIDEALLNFSKHPKLTMTDSVFVVIMSPGDGLWRQSAVVGGVRNKPSDAVLDVEKVHERLYTKNCPALMNKPKIIIIQACSEVWGEVRTLSLNEPWNEIQMRLPREKDFFSIVTSSPPYIGQYKSSFIQCIVRVFNSCVCEDHIEELFTKVIEHYEEFNSWRLPIQRCTLSKHFYLFPEDFSQKGIGAAWTQSVPAEQRLLSARTQFVHRVSETLLDQLLKTLLECRVITEDEVEEVAETEIRAVKAQMLIDTVRRKGSKASSALIAALWEEAPRLSTELKLIPGDSEVRKTDMKTNQKEPPSSFTPELQTESAQVLYRFRCPGPGVFQCSLTGLVFDMAQEAELLYRTIQWKDGLLQPAGKTPAGPLFSIECSEDALCQLHLPHCETENVMCAKGLLSVVHVTDDGMSFLEPLEVTDTHVVVDVPHLSAFGLVWALEVLAKIWDYKKPISGQVLLFLDPPHLETQKQNLNVFLLPLNIPLEEVKVQHEESKYIKTSCKCKLIKDQLYTVHCPTADIIQPKEEEFDLNYGPNYHPMFQLRLSIETKEVTVTVRDQTETDVWKRVADLTCPAVALNVPAEQTLFSIRTQFIESVSEPVLHKLLNKLLQCTVITDEELEVIAVTQTRAEKARVLIDTVRRKGSEAISALLTALCEVDPCLSKKLNLNQRQSRPVWTRSRSLWSDLCRLL